MQLSPSRDFNLKYPKPIHGFSHNRNLLSHGHQTISKLGVYNDVDGSGNEGKNKKIHIYIKVANIHFNSPSKLAFKSNSFYCNLVRKLIPN